MLTIGPYHVQMAQTRTGRQGEQLRGRREQTAATSIWRPRNLRVPVAMLVAIIFGSSVMGSTARGAATTAAASKTPVVVMGIGDSLMAGEGDGQGGLLRKFRADLAGKGYAVDYVGDVASPVPSDDLVSMGYGGRCIGAPADSGINCGFVDQQKGIYGLVQGRIGFYKPQVVLIMAGVNDRSCTTPAICGDVIQSWKRLLDLIYSEAPNAIVLLSTGKDWVNTVSDFYSEQRPLLVAMTAEQRSAGRRVFFVNAYDGIVATDSGDGLHLTPAGYDKMGSNYASAFFANVAPLLPTAATTATTTTATTAKSKGKATTTTRRKPTTTKPKRR